MTMFDTAPNRPPRKPPEAPTGHGVEQLHIPSDLPPELFWPQVAAKVRRWLDSRGVPLRDSVLLLPFVELLPLARQAFAAQPGWQPRVETIQTLASSLAPDDTPSDDQDAVAAISGISGDPALDGLAVAALLRSQPALADWPERDPVAFDQAVSSVLLAATALQRGAAAVAPAARQAWWDDAREAVARFCGGSPMAGQLARLALEWAALSPAPASDRVLGHPAGAWLVLDAADQDPFGQLLLHTASQHGTPCLRLVADAALDNPFDAELPAPPELWLCQDAEQEAWAAAHAVLGRVGGGTGPVALIAEDRLLVRRVRALLDRAGLSLADETGWTLDTSFAGAFVMALLRAASPAAGPDAWLGWLKCAFTGAETAVIDRLERHWRRGAPLAPGATPPGDLAEALAWWQQQQARLQGFCGSGPAPLRVWLQRLGRMLVPTAHGGQAVVAGDWWLTDAAGRQVWQSLRLDDASARPDLDELPFDLAQFSRWVDSVLRQASFRPAAAQPQVVITPLARAMLRPFAAVVLPGADDQHLGPAPVAAGLLPQALLRHLGLADAAAMGRRAERAFVQLLRHPGVVMLRRQLEDGAPMADSPWWSRLDLSRQRRGLAPLRVRPPDEAWRPLHAAPVAPPAPVAASGLPSTLSASALESLRACPYQFFARSVLRLGEHDELEADPGKREFGTLLHAVLHRFHEDRRQRADAELGEPAVQRLLLLADAQLRESGLDAAALLPFSVGLAAFARRYLVWLAGRDAEGWSYQAGELSASVAPAALGGLTLRGRIDRIDQRLEAGGGGPTWQLLDYKTGAAATLKERVKQPLEDTQLAFYAALLLHGGVADAALPPAAALEAAYLALDERGGLLTVPHADVADSAQALVDGLADDWSRLAAGAVLPALGEEPLCGYCEARGLCRRDHWWEGTAGG